MLKNDSYISDNDIDMMNDVFHVIGIDHTGCLHDCGSNDMLVDCGDMFSVVHAVDDKEADSHDLS